MSEALDIREQQLRDELRRLSSDAPDERATTSFSGRLVRAQMERRAADVRAELDDLLDRRFVIRLINTRNAHSIDTNLLAQLLSRFQSAIHHVGWALRAGPGVEGEPPATITARTATQVLALAPGSFEIVLRGAALEMSTDEGSENELDSLLDTSLSQVLALAKAAAEDEFPDSLEQLTQELGARPTRRLSLWFKKLAENSLTADLIPAGHPENATTLTPAQSRALSEWLAHVQDSVERITVTGVLRVADDVRGRFGIEDAAGHLYEGKAAPELVQHKEIGAEYIAEVQTTVTVGQHTGARTERYQLVSLNAVT